MLHIKGTAVLDTLEAIKARVGKVELDKIVSHLDPETREILRQPISPSSWYSCEAFSRFLEADIRETAGGNEQELVKRAEAVIEKQLSGIYKMFVRLGSPEFVIRRIAAVHSTYFDGVQIITEMKGPNSATIQYVGFSPETPDYGIRNSWFFPEGTGDLRRKEGRRAFYRPHRSRREILRTSITLGLKKKWRQ